MGRIRGWAWTWLVLALCFSAWESAASLYKIPVPHGLFVSLPTVALLLAVLIAQPRFSAVRAVVAILVALLLRLMFLRGFDAVLRWGSSHLSNRLWQSLLLVLTALAVVLTVVAVVSLRESSTFVAAAIAAVVALLLPLVGTFFWFSSFDLRAFVLLGGNVGFSIAASVAMSFAAVWLGTRASDLLPFRGVSPGAADDLPPSGA